MVTGELRSLLMEDDKWEQFVEQFFTYSEDLRDIDRCVFEKLSENIRITFLENLLFCDQKNNDILCDLLKDEHFWLQCSRFKTKVDVGNFITMKVVEIIKEEINN